MSMVLYFSVYFFIENICFTVFFGALLSSVFSSLVLCS